MESLAKAFEDGDIISWNSSDNKPSSFEMVEQQSTTRGAPLVALILADGETIVATYPAALPEDIQRDQLLQICGSGAAFTLITGKGDDVEASRRFAFCRRFRRVSAGGRSDVGRRHTTVLVALATQPVFSLAPQALVAAEGALRIVDADASPGGGQAAAAARARTVLADVFKRVASAPDPLGVRAPHRELRRSERGRLSHCGFLGRLFGRLRTPADALRVVGAVLAERRILVYGVDATAVSACATAIASIPELYMGHKRLASVAWPHVFAPLLPTALVAYAGSPAPYIFGVHKANVGAALEHLGAGATGVIVVDVDVGVAHTTSRGDERAFALAENAGEPAATELSLGALGLGLARAVSDARV